MSGKTGAGVYGRQIEINIPLGSYPSIYQPEIHAIEACALEVAIKVLIGKKYTPM